jgi:hypothetical protein
MIKTKNKKTLKVKRKKLISKGKKKAVKKKTKKKTVKNGAVKKKTVTKKKLVKKKTKKRVKRKKILMEDIYAIINKVQFRKKKITFVTELTEAPTIENNIKDVGLDYKKVEMKTQVVFTILPNDEKYEDEMDNIHFDIMDDEIPDIGQIFG